MSAHYESTFALFAGGRASSVPGALVSSNYFDVLGVSPAAGRFFVASPDRTREDHPVAVISDAAWARLFGRDPSIIGQLLSVNGASLQIIGVAPRDFRGIRKGERWPDIWIPLGLAELTLRDAQGRPATIHTAPNLWFDYVGRRQPGVTMDQVQAEASLLAERLTMTEGNVTARVSRVWLNDPAKAGPALVGFMAIPMLVLAIACVNAANLLLARSARQERDWTVRLALGATRWRVVRQILTEAPLLAMGAAGLGLFLARWAVSLAASEVPVPMPLDYRVTVFTISVSLITAVTFSLGPALGVTSRATRRMAPVAGSAGASRSRVRFTLVAVQAALSLALLTTGAQFTKTVFAANPNAALIPDPQRLVMASFDVDPLRFSVDAGQDFYRRLLDHVRSVPGVAAAGLSTTGLVSGALSEGAGVRVWLSNTPPEGRGLVAFQISPGTLEAIGVPLLHGRHFTAADSSATRHVIVNRPFAEKFLDGVALGRTFRLGRAASTQEPAHEVTVIGVVGGILKRSDLEPPMVYYPSVLGYQPARVLYVRIDGTGTFTAAALQSAARDVDPRVPVAEASTLNDTNAARHSEIKLLARGAAWLGLIALVLAAGGLYSVVAYVVLLRRQEVGIRLALGADAGTIVAMIIRQALTPTLVGATLGAGCAATAGAVIRSRMYGASPVDPLAFGGTVVVMVLVMIAASWIPARHAGRVDPIEVLRTE